MVPEILFSVSASTCKKSVDARNRNKLYKAQMRERLAALFRCERNSCQKYPKSIR